MAGPKRLAALPRNVGRLGITSIAVGGIIGSGFFARAATVGPVAGPVPLLTPMFLGAAHPITVPPVGLFTTPFDLAVLVVSGLAMFAWGFVSEVRPHGVPAEGSEPSPAGDRSAALSVEARS